MVSNTVNIIFILVGILHHLYNFSTVIGHPRIEFYENGLLRLRKKSTAFLSLFLISF